MISSVKKALSMLTAVAMIVSAGSTLMFAAPSSTNIPDSGVWDSGVPELVQGDRFIPTSATLMVENREYTTSTKGTKSVRVDETGSLNSSDLALALHGTVFNRVSINNRSVAVTLKAVAQTTNARSTTTTYGLQAIPNINVGNADIVFNVGAMGRIVASNGTVKATSAGITMNPSRFVPAANSSNEYVGDITIENLSGVTIFDVFYADNNGPVPLVEKGAENDSDGVRSNKTLYFMVHNTAGLRFNDDSYWKMRANKGSNGKYVKKISDVSKTFSKGMIALGDSSKQVVDGTIGRNRFIKVEMNELYTDDEYKITLDVRMTPKQKAIDVFGVDDDAQIKVKDFSFYVKNSVKDADNEWSVGINGLMLNPLENDWNEVTYYDEDGDLAFVKFFADSDIDKFYAKLSTKWEHADYASYFNDQESFTFQFVGSPKLSATSRADLQIYNPFLDEDGNETIDPETAVIYQVVDGDLIDVTDSFTYAEGDNGDMAYICRTRFLGTYIICEKAVEEATR